MTPKAESITYQKCLDNAAALLDAIQQEMAEDPEESLPLVDKWIALAREIRESTYLSEQEFKRIKQELEQTT